MSQNVTQLTNSTETSNINDDYYQISELKLFLILIFAICVAFFFLYALKFFSKRK